MLLRYGASWPQQKLQAMFSLWYDVECPRLLALRHRVPTHSPLLNLLSIPPRVCSLSMLPMRKVDYDERWGALAKLMAMPIRKVVFNAQARKSPLSPERPIFVSVTAVTFPPMGGHVIVPLAHPPVVGYRIETFDISKYRIFDVSIVSFVFSPPYPGTPSVFQC